MLSFYAPEIHDLKCIDPYFDEIVEGIKTFELRRDDREYQVGDVLILRHYYPKIDRYSGRFIIARVSYILRGETWLQPGYVAMSIQALQ